MPGRTEDWSLNVWTNPIPCQRGQKIYLNSCWPKPSHARVDTKCVPTCVDQTPPMPARTQNLCNMCCKIPLNAIEGKHVSQHMMTKPLPCQRGNKVHLHLLWPNPSYIGENTMYIWTCVDQNPWKPTRTQHVSQHALSNPSHTIKDTKCINICWPNASHSNEDTKSISTCFIYHVFASVGRFQLELLTFIFHRHPNLYIYFSVL